MPSGSELISTAIAADGTAVPAPSITMTSAMCKTSIVRMLISSAVILERGGLAWYVRSDASSILCQAALTALSQVRLMDVTRQLTCGNGDSHTAGSAPRTSSGRLLLFRLWSGCRTMVDIESQAHRTSAIVTTSRHRKAQLLVTGRRVER